MKIYKQSDINVFFIESVSDAPVSDVSIERNGEFISIKRPRLQLYDIKDVHFTEIQDANGFSFTSASTCEAYLNSQLGVTAPSGGSPGPSGTRGSVWTTGSGAPASSTAQAGDMYLDTSTGDVYRWS